MCLSCDVQNKIALNGSRLFVKQTLDMDFINREAKGSFFCVSQWLKLKFQRPILVIGRPLRIIAQKRNFVTFGNICFDIR